MIMIKFDNVEDLPLSTVSAFIKHLLYVSLARTQRYIIKLQIIIFNVSPILALIAFLFGPLYSTEILHTLFSKIKSNKDEYNPSATTCVKLVKC